MTHQRFSIDINGLGLVALTKEAMRDVTDGTDYLEDVFWDGDNVTALANAGHVVGISTGSSGTYVVNVHLRPPTPEECNAQFTLTTFIVVEGTQFSLLDLYDLMEWAPELCEDYAVDVPHAGRWKMTWLSSLPLSGVVGDQQQVGLYLEPLAVDADTPVFDDIPELCG